MLDPMAEVLLTAWAAGSLKEPVALSVLFPQRLASPLRRARRLGLVESDVRGVYLTEEGT